jgi:alkanesulfonate monooxygenase SsuD/methylene tetrahydromethanopterin reductase-like flavin-dependent oxidoreductase (luciferase family)
VLPPVLVGGHSDLALRRAARHDGWIGVHYALSEALEHLERMRRLRREAGRMNGHFEIALALQDPPDQDARRRLEDAGMTILLHPAPWPADSVGTTTADRRDALERAAARLLG